MSFVLTQRHPLPHLDGEVCVYRDERTGMRHVHVACDDRESAFILDFPTLPRDHSGVAHILEHLVLCGSERHPVRGLYAHLLPRTAASFINAYTGTHSTQYVAASPDSEDCLDLLDVLAHTTFVPTLDYRDFLQEAWRLVRGEDGKPALDGVVFNEMRGAMADPDAVHFQEIAQVLQLGGDGWNAGGAPAAIPSLAYEELVRFHRQHYHPAHATLFTYGPMPAAAFQAKMTPLLAREWPKAELLELPLANLPQGGRVAVDLPAQDGEDTGYRTTLAWRWPAAEHTAELGLAIEVMVQALTAPGTAGAQRLDDAGLGEIGVAGDPFLDREPCLLIGIEGLEAGQVADAETLLQSLIDDAATKGISQADLDAAFRDVELSYRRRLPEDNQPHGLCVLARTALDLQRGLDVQASLCATAHLAALRERIGHPEGAAAWVRTFLRDNPHRVVIEGRPSTQWNERLTRLNESALAQALERVGEDCLDTHATLLAERQAERAMSELLPSVPLARLADADVVRPDIQSGQIEGVPVDQVVVANGGLIELHIEADVSDIPAEEREWVGLALSMVFEVGTKRDSWSRMAQRAAAAGFEFEAALITGTDANGHLRLLADIKGVALERDGEALATVLADTLLKTRFRERTRVSHLLDTLKNAMLPDIDGYGHDAAQARALAHLSPLYAAEDEQGGFHALDQVVRLRAEMRTPDGARAVLARLDAAMEQVRNAPLKVWAIGPTPQESATALAKQLPAGCGVRMLQSVKTVRLPAPSQLALLADTTVGYTHEVFAGPRREHPDGPAAQVLAHLITDGFLHAALRERGGAYDGRLECDPRGALAFSSYRDPRLAGTFDDYHATVEAVCRGDIPEQALEGAVRTALRKLNPPMQPEEAATDVLDMQRNGWTREGLVRFQKQLMAVSLADVQRVARRWLVGQPSSRVALVGWDRRDEAMRCGLEIRTLATKAPGRQGAKPR